MDMQFLGRLDLVCVLCGGGGTFWKRLRTVHTYWNRAFRRKKAWRAKPWMEDVDKTKKKKEEEEEKSFVGQSEEDEKVQKKEAHKEGEPFRRADDDD